VHHQVVLQAKVAIAAADLKGLGPVRGLDRDPGANGRPVAAVFAHQLELQPIALIANVIAPQMHFFRSPTFFG
jgi:hypothetical protein